MTIDRAEALVVDDGPSDDSPGDPAWGSPAHITCAGPWV